jgi:lysophospholipase L1-like esterase
VKIICIGDSITAGQHLDEGYAAWPALLSSRLGHPVIARGVPGDTTRLGLERFPRDVQSQSPDVVVIQFGHNDANRWQTDLDLPRVSFAAYIANLAEMVERVRTFDAKPFLCTISPTYRSPGHADDCARYDRGLRDVAEDLDVPLLDVRPVIEERHLLDGLHLNFDGHVLYASIVGAGL